MIYTKGLRQTSCLCVVSGCTVSPLHTGVEGRYSCCTGRSHSGWQSSQSRCGIKKMEIKEWNQPYFLWLDCKLNYSTICTVEEKLFPRSRIVAGSEFYSEIHIVVAKFCLLVGSQRKGLIPKHQRVKVEIRGWRDCLSKIMGMTDLRKSHSNNKITMHPGTPAVTLWHLWSTKGNCVIC